LGGKPLPKSSSNRPSKGGYGRRGRFLDGSVSGRAGLPYLQAKPKLQIRTDRSLLLQVLKRNSQMKKNVRVLKKDQKTTDVGKSISELCSIPPVQREKGSSVQSVGKNFSPRRGEIFSWVLTDKPGRGGLPKL